MSRMYRKVTVLTTTHIPNKQLLSDTQIAFTVTPPNPETRPYPEIPVAWKVLNFAANNAMEESIPVQIKRRVSVANTINVQSAPCVTTSDSGAGLGPNQYVTLSHVMRWSSYTMQNMPPNTTFVVNNSGSQVALTIGSKYPQRGSQFEPMVLLPELSPDAGTVVHHPSLLQAYSVTDCTVGQVLRDTGRGLIRDSGVIRPVNLNDTQEDIVLHLYTREDGVPVLEKKDIRHSTPPRIPPAPPPLVIPSPVFSGRLNTPPAVMPPRLPLSPFNVASPQFLFPLHTPPQTPRLQLFHAQPLSPGSPGFGSPLETPVHTIPVWV